MKTIFTQVIVAFLATAAFAGGVSPSSSAQGGSKRYSGHSTATGKGFVCQVFTDLSALRSIVSANDPGLREVNVLDFGVLSDQIHYFAVNSVITDPTALRAISTGNLEVIGNISPTLSESKQLALLLDGQSANSNSTVDPVETATTRHVYTLNADQSTAASLAQVVKDAVAAQDLRLNVLYNDDDGTFEAGLMDGLGNVTLLTNTSAMPKRISFKAQAKNDGNTTIQLQMQGKVALKNLDNRALSILIDCTGDTVK